MDKKEALQHILLAVSSTIRHSIYETEFQHEYDEAAFKVALNLIVRIVQSKALKDIQTARQFKSQIIDYINDHCNEITNKIAYDKAQIEKKLQSFP